MDLNKLLPLDIFGKGLALLGLLSILTLSVGAANAANYTISCDDREDASSCSVTGSGGLNDDFAETLQDLLRIANGDANQVTDFCTPGDGQDNYICDVNQVRLFCNVNATLETASCNLGSQPPLQDLLDVDCNTEGEGAVCNVEANPDTAREALQDDAPEATLNVESALLAGCAAQTGSDAFQRDCAAILAAVQAGDVAAANATMEAIAHLNAEEAVEQAQIAARASLGHVFSRLGRLRNNQVSQTDVDTSALQIFDGNKWVRPGEMLAENHSDTVIDVSPDISEATFESFGRIGFFIDGSILGAEHQDNAVERGSEIATQLLTWGFDYRFNERLVGGLAFSAGNTGIDYNANRGDLNDLSFMLLAYGGTYYNNFYFDGSLGLGGNDYSQTRRLVCNASCVAALQGMNQTASSEFSGRQTTLSLAAGYDWVRNALSITPYAQLLAVDSSINGYRETMSNPGGIGGGLALDISDVNYDTSSLSFGTKVQYVLNQDWGVFVPHGGLQVFKILDNEPAVIEGSFVGDISDLNNFRVASRPIDDSYFVLNFGGLFQLANGVSAFGDLRIIAGNDDLDQFQLTAGARWEL